MNLTVTLSDSAPGMQVPLAPEEKSMLLPPGLLPAEEQFYQNYSWCLNPCLSVRETVERLQGELARLNAQHENWQRNEVMTNVFLLGCALLNSADEYLHGPVYQLPRRAEAIPFARLTLKAIEKVLAWKRMLRVRRAAAWRQAVIAALVPFLRHYIEALTTDLSPPAGAGDALLEAMHLPLPTDLQNEFTHLPSAFRKLDMTPGDVLALGKQFITRFPDRQQPILVVGLRTAGSCFAPLFRAMLEDEGYQTVAIVTCRPDKGLGSGERAILETCARQGYLAALLDDPPASGETFAHAADLLRNLGFPADHLTALFTEHPLQRNRRASHESVSFTNLLTLVIEPEQWHKARLLEPAAVAQRLNEYFQNRGYVSAQLVTTSARAEEFNRQLADLIEEERRNRLKRVYEVRLKTADGSTETRFVLAKSVGAGYLSYHAFLVGSRLDGFVPPLLGLRDGILFSEWIPQQDAVQVKEEDREAWIEAIASYTAARVRLLPMPAATLEQGLHKHNHGLELLDGVLCKAYGSSAIAKLMRGRVRRRLASQLCPVPTLIDGKMRPAEWLGGAALLKSDGEHHGMGKNELNIVDPAYDLAEAILQFELSAEEESRLVQRYRSESKDATVQDRLFMAKLLAGLSTMSGAMRNLEQRHLAQRQQKYHREFVRAWDFLTVQTARHCGRLCRPMAPPSWGSPLVVLDVDGVIDQRIFGFPCTTASGIEALALLHAHGFPIALNTARSVTEVQAYCEAYGCAGAVAEYGSYVWDAVRQRGRVLISSAAQEQLQRARQALARLPGVFVNDGYEYSIKACTYEDGAPVPLPTPLIQRFIADYKLDQLCLHQTTIDSTMVARDVNKGTGLTALLDWVGIPETETLAVGDSEPDLAMFRVASRSFAPGHIGCARLARFLGCKIAPYSTQRGLLHIVRSLVHADGERCERCSDCASLAKPGEDLFMDVLKVADQKRSRLFWRAVFHSAAFEVFVR